MAEIRYKIPILSVRALTAYAKEQSDEVYSYNLTKNETESVIQRGSETYQNENAIFYQAMQQITNHEFTQPQIDTVIDDLYDVLIYLDFDGIFDRNPAMPVNALHQKKAESLFRPEGINLDFGTGSKNYIAFERSASMSRKARLSFVRADIFNPLLLSITMNLPIKNCELSKLYAYNGLMFSSGKRVETDLFGNADNIVIVDNPSVIVKDVPVVTVRDVTGKGSVRKYERIEKTDDIDVTAFDGEGFVAPEFAEEINTKLYGKQNRHRHTSFQIRLPYIKGMIHQVDFKAFFAEYGITQIIDIWGKAHNVNNIKMILTKSQFKCASWLNEDWMVNPSGLIAERLGGADYDGDMIKIIADPIINDCVTSHYISTSKDRPLYSHINNLPLLQIPSAKPVKSDFADWYSRFQTVKSTFSARIGQISNAALSRSILAYDESIDEELRGKYISDIEMLEILTGLEIDSVKSGIKPNLSKYLNGRSVQRSRFLQYKEIVEKSEGVHLWYEPTFEEQFKEYFADTDWSTVSSNVEKLPYYAMMLKKNTKKAKAKPAKASDLFAFAVDKGWEKKLNPKGLAEVKRIIETYDQCLKRIRAYTRNTGRKKKYNDVACILFMRVQEGEYDADTLYTLFINLPPEKVSEILEAARNEKWQFMNYDCRMRFLIKHLPEEEFSEYYGLLSDFSFGGYRVLTDILIDTDNYNSENSLRKLKFPTDSKEMTELIDAYINNAY